MNTPESPTGSMSGLGDGDEDNARGGMQNVAPPVHTGAADAYTPHPPVPPAQQTAAIPAKGLPKTVTIILEEGEHIPPTGQAFGINGVHYMVQPGVEVTVPEGIVNVLEDAIVEKPILSSDGMKIIGQRRMLRFPYRVVRGA